MKVGSWLNHQGSDTYASINSNDGTCKKTDNRKVKSNKIAKSTKVQLAALSECLSLTKKVILSLQHQFKLFFNPSVESYLGSPLILLLCHGLHSSYSLSKIVL